MIISKAHLLEIIAAIAFAAMNIYSCIWVSAAGGIAFHEIYGVSIDDNKEMFSLMTRASLSGYLWGPVVILFALIASQILRFRNRNSVWPIYAFAFVISAATASIALGITQPYLKTTFRMGN